MKIEQKEYPIKSTRKYSVIHNGEEYTCYLNCFNGNLVVSGDGNSRNYRNITDSRLGMEIILACHNY